MRYILIILLISSIGYSQTIDIPKCKLNQKTTLEKILYTELAVLSYGVIDYMAYNMMKGWSVEHYRFIQGVAFSAINYLLYKYVSYKSAIGFSLQVWGGNPDMIYYGIDRVSGGFNGFSYGNEFGINKQLSHLNFMPTTLDAERITGIDLIVNNILTKGISILIQF